jgi:hypothetical protein
MKNKTLVALSLNPINVTTPISYFSFNFKVHGYGNI